LQRTSLGKHIREVEWQEIGCDEDVVGECGLYQIPEAVDGNDEIKLLSFSSRLDVYKDIDSPLQTEFWLPNTPHGASAAHRSVTEGLRQQTVDGFTDKFQAAIDELPKLTTFISRPMPRTRKIITSGYPVSAEFLQASPRPLARLQPETGLIEANDGLFLFLLPAMNRPTSTVTRLKWVGELPGWSYMRPMPLSSALRRLRSLDLSPTPALSRAWANRQQ